MLCCDIDPDPDDSARKLHLRRSRQLARYDNIPSCETDAMTAQAILMLFLSYPNHLSDDELFHNLRVPAIVPRLQIMC